MKWKEYSPKTVKRYLFKALQAYVGASKEICPINLLSRRFKLSEKDVRFFLNVEALKLENSIARGPRLYRRFEKARLVAVKYINGPEDVQLAQETHRRTLHRGKKWRDRQHSIETHLPPIIQQPLVEEKQLLN